MLIDIKAVAERKIGELLSETVKVTDIKPKDSSSWTVLTEDGRKFTILKESPGGFSVWKQE